ncbi:MAG: FAD binding domain-containing protein [Actinobacteria bacterium]|nr:FAD binding domain-containing protein [Actinomycetota bacterium]
MKPAPFAYHRVHSVEAALERLHELGEEAKPIAGGQSLAPLMAFRLARPTALVDISRLAELAHLARVGDELRVGALTRHATVESGAAQCGEGFEVLSRSARFIGHGPIRRRGTFGGSLAHGDPSAEWCLLALALDAVVIARDRAGERAIDAGDFFTGYFSTALAPDELLVEVRFPRPRPHSSLKEFSRRRGDFALVGVAVALDLDRAGRCEDVRIAFGGVDDVPVRVAAAERLLEGEPAEADAFRAAAELCGAELGRGLGDEDGRLKRRLMVELSVEALGEASAGVPG